ncbi:MAG: T9SS type A sorting domain-containing protein [Ferruginibacter sp.]
MRNQYLSFLFIFIFSLSLSYVQAQSFSIGWQKCYGGSQNEGALNMIPTNDGGYLICGSAASTSGDLTNNYGQSDVWLLKIDILGTIQWQKCFGGSGSESGIKVRQTSDGGYIVGAQTTSNNNGLVGPAKGSIDGWVVKLTSTGGVSWQKVFGGSAYDFLRDIQQTTDGGYIVAIDSDSQDGDITNPKGNFDSWILKLDATGYISWQKTIGGSNSDGIMSIIQTSDGGYIGTGATYSTDGDVTVNPSGTGRSTWVVKFNSAGGIDWQKAYGSDGDHTAGNKITATSDGGYIVASYCHQNGGDVTDYHSGTDGWIIKLDASGNLTWQKTLGGSSDDWIGNVIPSGDGGYFCVGGTYSSDGDITFNQGNKDVWVVKLSSTGSLLWQKTFGGDDHDEADAGPLCLTPDGGLLVAGDARSNNTGDVGPNHSDAGLDDIWVVKLVPDVAPVVLGNFDAIAKRPDVLCNWKTMQEQNSSHFIVERSYDAVHFNEAGKVNAKGNSALPTGYNFIDKNACLSGAAYLYYRLKIVDVDGTYKYSSTVKVNVKYNFALNIYPNPVVDVLTVDLTSLTREDAVITIIDAAGKKMYQKNITIEKGKNTIPINTTFLPGDTYILSVNGKQYYTAEFIKIIK